MPPGPVRVHTLSLHDALPICRPERERGVVSRDSPEAAVGPGSWMPRCFKRFLLEPGPTAASGDRKSTRLNSSHRCISYAVFCLKKKKIYQNVVTSIDTLG